MNLTVTWEFTLSTDGDLIGDLPNHAETVMKELLALEECDESLTDSAVGLDTGSMTVEISVSVKDLSYENALSHAMATVRAAIHAAGGFTSGWPNGSLKPLAESLQYEAGEIHAVLI